MKTFKEKALMFFYIIASPFILLGVVDKFLFNINFSEYPMLFIPFIIYILFWFEAGNYVLNYCIFKYNKS